ncbi:MAG: hypothetical protein JXR96_21840 [Deltaproteobacteria bacterium]|nr:hypothetical protein [Deltaproteobacteria bacterium]
MLDALIILLVGLVVVFVFLSLLMALIGLIARLGPAAVAGQPAGRGGDEAALAAAAAVAVAAALARGGPPRPLPPGPGEPDTWRRAGRLDGMRGLQRAGGLR